MLDSASKAFFHLLAQSGTLKKLASRVRHAPARRASRGASSPARRSTRRSTRRAPSRRAACCRRSTSSARASPPSPRPTRPTRDYLEVIDAIVASGIERNLSLKLTQLGLDVDRASAVDNLRKILERAAPAGFFVRIDMENSRYTDVTLEIFETLWQQGYRQIGVVLQSALYRSEQDLARVNALGARVRLVKGAYKEPKPVAYPKKADVDAAYARMLKVLLTDGHYPAPSPRTIRR